MKAAVIHGHGDIDVVCVEDVAEPKAGLGEVVIQVLCAGLNHLDIWVRKGRPGATLQTPHVLGSDAVGIVVALGQGVMGLEVGEPVIVNPALSCGCCEFCGQGQHSQCVSFGLVGLSRPGTFAEYVALPAANCHSRPAHLTDEEAGVLALAHVTAWRMLMTQAGLRPGESVLIHGVGGGVALAALQLAKLTGAEVFVTSSADEKLARAGKMGADHALNYAKGDVAKWIADATSGRGVDVVVDAVGAAVWPLDFTCVRKGGRVVLCGVTTGPKAETNLQALYWNQLRLMGSTMGSAEDFRQMIRAVTVNELRPVVDRALPLDNARDAVHRMETSKQFGKIALRTRA